MSTGGADEPEAPRLRASTIEGLLAERPSGWPLGALAERLSPHFDVGDVLVVLRARSDLFFQSDGRWLSRQHSLLQLPRRLPWTFSQGVTPPVWGRFHNPEGAARGWSRFRDDVCEVLFDPSTKHVTLECSTKGQRFVLHIDHTIIFDRATWVIWTVTSDESVLSRLDEAGLFLWNPLDGRALVDFESRRPRHQSSVVPTLASWCLYSPLDSAEVISWLILERFNVLSPKWVTRRVEREEISHADRLAFSRARRVYENGGRGPSDYHCLKCGNMLTDPNSIALGYGPECARRLGTAMIRALYRGREGVLRAGAVPLPDVRRRFAECTS